MEQPRPNRILVLCLLVTLAGGAAYALFGTPTGRHILDNRKQDREAIHRWVHSHELIARTTLVAVYVLLTVAVLPVWWLQVLAGFCLDFFTGLFWCQLSATIAAVIVHQISRWLLADWVHNNLEARMAKLRALDEKLGHNGLLVVMTTRLTHLAPFGLSNYLFGVTTISAMDITLGTLLGGIPTASFYVMLGAAPHRLKDWRFVSSLVVVNLVLLVPLLLRYLRPDWFRKIGVE